jgi:hypothetical protein
LGKLKSRDHLEGVDLAWRILKRYCIKEIIVTMRAGII